MHGNVFYGAGGAPVNLLREVEAAWVAGRVVGGNRNWVTTGSTQRPARVDGHHQRRPIPGFAKRRGPRPEARAERADPRRRARLLRRAHRAIHFPRRSFLRL